MSPRSAEATIEINAPIDVVWRVVNDFPAYANWNPFVVKAQCSAVAPQVGDAMQLRVRWKDGAEVTSKERFTLIAPPALTQQGTTRAQLVYRFDGPMHWLGLVRASRTQSLEQAAGGLTVYTSTEVFSGLFAAGVPLALVQDGFERHAQALKRHAESLT
jgi:hypothetical protein